MRIYIDDLAVKTTIGVLAWEKELQQTLYISLEIDYNASSACQTDDITNALDYAQLCQTVTQYCRENTHQLLEALALNLANLLVSLYPIEQLKIKLRKPQAVSNAKDVGVVLNLTPKTSLLT